jgi:outer membrane usher protein FimD/PapC
MTKLCPRGKAAAKRKFKVYPSAYANAYASRICAGKIKDPSGVKRKDFRGPKPMKQGDMVNVKKFNPGALSTIAPNTQGPETPVGFDQDFDKINQRTEEDNFLRGVSPFIEKSGSAVAGVQAGEERIRGGVGFDTKIGNIGLEAGKSTRTQSGMPDFQEKNINLNYNKNIPITEKTNLDITGGVGRSSSKFQGFDETKREQDTYNIGARVNYRFGQGKMSGGLANEKQFKYVKGGFEEGDYQDYVLDLIK